MRTRSEYVRYARVLGRHYHADPEILTEAQVRAYFVYLRAERKFAGSSMTVAIAALRSFFRDHLHLGDWSLWREIKVRREQTLPIVLSREEVALLLSCVSHRRFRVILRLIYHCGLRLSEALHLETRDIDRAAGRIHIRLGKGGKDRYVPIAPAMIDELGLFWMLHRNPQYLFPGVGRDWKWQKTPIEVAARKAKQPMSASAVQNAFRVALALSGMKKPATVHTLRHCFATHLLEEGVSIRLISQYLGHHSLDVTVIYTHLTSTNEEKTRLAQETLLAATARAPKR